MKGFCGHLSHPSFFEDQDPKTEPRLSRKIMQIRFKPAGLEDQDPRAESRFWSQDHANKLSTRWFGDVWRRRIPKLKLDLVPKSCKFAVDQLVWKIRVRTLNVDFSPKIMQIHCQQRSTRWFGDVWRIRIPKLKLDLVPKSCKFAVNQMVWGMRILNLNLHLVPKSCKNNSKSARLEHQHPKSKIFKINFAS